jgi:hypothetical protein
MHVCHIFGYLEMPVRQAEPALRGRRRQPRSLPAPRAYCLARGPMKKGVPITCAPPPHTVSTSRKVPGGR